MPIDQISIALLGAAAAWLSQDARPRMQRWACVFGLIGQPFWYWATWRAGQWGMFALSLLYTVAWVRGVWQFWVLPARAWRSTELPATRQ